MRLPMQDSTFLDLALAALRDHALPLVRDVIREELGRFSGKDPERLVGAEEAARLLDMTPAAVRKAALRGSLPSRRIGRRMRFRVGDLLAR